MSANRGYTVIAELIFSGILAVLVLGGFAGLVYVSENHVVEEPVTQEDPESFGAPSSNITRDLVPDNDSERFVGTTTPSTRAYSGVIADTISAVDGTATSSFTGGIDVDSGLQITSLISCDTLDTDASGNVICGTDDAGSGGATFGQAWELTAAADALAPTTTVGLIVSASSTINSTLDVTGASTFDSTLGVSGLATFSNTSNSAAIAERLIHDGDTDTYLQFEANTTNLVSGGVRLLHLGTAGQDIVSVNHLFQDVDFQVRGDDAADGLFFNAASGEGDLHVGSATGVATARLEVTNGDAQDSFLVDNGNFVVDQNGNVGVGSSTPGTLLSVDGVANFTTSTSTIYNGLIVSSQGLAVPTLISCDTIDTDANGVFVCGTDATGGGGSTFGQAWELTPDAGALAPTTTVGAILSASSTISQLTLSGLSTEGFVTNDSAGLLTSSSTIAQNFIDDAIARDSEVPADEVGTLTSGDLCINDGSLVNCTVNTEAELETALDSLDVVTVTAGDITEANLYTILSDVTQFYESGDEDTIVGAISSGAIANDTIIEPDLNADVAPDDGDYLQYDSTGTNFTWRNATELVSDIENAVESALDTLINLATVTISTTLTIPFGTSCDSNADGELCQDTTDDQIVVDGKVIQTKNRIWGATIASTSPDFISGGLLKVPTNLDGYTMTNIRCSVDGGTSKVIAVEDESTNSTEDITCGTSVTSDDGSITNATVTAGEEMYIDFGATSGTVDYVTISVFGDWTRE